jgi:hypothetical protein
MGAPKTLLTAQVNRSLRTWLSETRRYLKGAQPVPRALESVLEYLSNRPQWEIEGWAEQAGLDGIEPQVARFVFDFFNNREVPVGRVRLDDRLQADLQLNKALPQEWGDEFQEEFMDRFGVSKLFRPGPPPATVRELLLFVQQELNDWRSRP